MFGLTTQLLNGELNEKAFNVNNVGGCPCYYWM